MMIDIPSPTPQAMLAASVFLAVFLIAAVLFGRQSHAKPYERYESILTPAEQNFYRVLSSIMRDHAIIMAKVRIADIVRVKKSVPRKSFWRLFSKISQKHIDFVLIEPRTLRTLCLIELDDKSHAQDKRIARDKFVNQMMQEVEIPLLRFAVKQRYDRPEIMQRLEPCLTRKPKL